MTTHNGTVQNGRATITMDTTDMNAGKYKMGIGYLQDNKYNASNCNSKVELKEWEVIADISSTSTEWTQTPLGNELQSTGSYNIWKTVIPDDVTLLIHGTKNGESTSNIFCDLRETMTGNSSSISIHDNSISKWGGVGSGRIPFSLIPSGEFILFVTKSNGIFTFKIKDSSQTRTVSVNIGSQLNNCYMAFSHVGGNGFTIDTVKYHYNTNGGGVTPNIHLTHRTLPCEVMT